MLCLQYAMGKCISSFSVFYSKRQVTEKIQDKEEKVEAQVILKTLLFAAFVNSLYQGAVSRKGLGGHIQTRSTFVNVGAIIYSFHFFRLSFRRLIDTP